MAFLIFGVPESIRTTGPFLRREVLYPAELRGRVKKFVWYSRIGEAVQSLSENLEVQK